MYLTDPAVGRWRFLWAHYLPRKGWTHAAHWPELARGVRGFHVESGMGRQAIVHAMEEMTAWVGRSGPRAVDFALNALERALLWMDLEHGQGRDLAVDARIRAVAERLERQTGEPFDLAALTRGAGLSVSRLAHLFREQWGVPPRQYAEEQKMRHAAQLLALTSLSVAEVAEACGFADAFYFSTRFLKWSKSGPRAFRQAAAGRGKAFREK